MFPFLVPVLVVLLSLLTLIKNEFAQPATGHAGSCQSAFASSRFDILMEMHVWHDNECQVDHLPVLRRGELQERARARKAILPVVHTCTSNNSLTRNIFKTVQNPHCKKWLHSQTTQIVVVGCGCCSLSCCCCCLFCCYCSCRPAGSLCFV